MYWLSGDSKEFLQSFRRGLWGFFFSYYRQSYCPYLRFFGGSLLVRKHKGIAIWNDYSLFKRTNILYDPVWNWLEFPALLMKLYYFMVCFSLSVFSFHNKRRGTFSHPAEKEGKNVVYMGAVFFYAHLKNWLHFFFNFIFISLMYFLFEFNQQNYMF